jgi:hypothetical protein
MLIPVHQADEIDVLLESAGLAAEVLEHPRLLLGLGGDLGRQEASEAERIPLGIGEAGALVESRVVR